MELRLPEPFYPRGEHLAVDLPGARALFTTRRGGFSEGPYASLNLGRLTADRPEAVQRNRARLESEIGRPPAFIRQVHGTTVRIISALSDDGIAPLPDEGIELPEADGQATALPDVAPMVMTADCLPIAIAGEKRSRWCMRAGGGSPAGSWPRGCVRCASSAPRNRSVRPLDPAPAVVATRWGTTSTREFADFGDRARRGRNLDLKTIAREQLERAGVEQVYDVGLCTICSDPSLFFSHRRDRGVTGRQAGLAWLS